MEPNISKTNSPLNIYFFIGTTAELIRIAPIVKELNHRGISPKIITSGQVKVHFEDIRSYCKGLCSYIALREKADKSSPVRFFFWTIKTLIRTVILLRSEFKNIDKGISFFVICGDPVSTTIGALSAFIHGLKIVHIESGDLSFNLMEPFPEEICRNINLAFADILFPPSQWAENNLQHHKKIKINTHYNTQLETFFWAMNQKTPPINQLIGKKYYILIMHRQEHVFFRKGWTKKTLKLVIENSDPNLTCVLFNYPITVSLVRSLGYGPLINSGKIIILQPVSYPTFLKLVKGSQYIATDGATNQYEAYLMGKPCLLLRDFTEQIEGIGKNVVLYKSQPKVIKEFLHNYPKYNSKPVKTKIKPSKIVVDNLFKLSALPYRIET